MTPKKFTDLAKPIYDDPNRRARVAEFRHEAEADIVAQRLADLRQSLGIDQAELAERLGITQSGVSRILSSHDPKVSTLHRICEALGGSLRISVDLNGQLIELTQPVEGAA